MMNQISIGHPPTPFKGGIAQVENPPLKGVGGCPMEYLIHD
jgi:hypothetical protein